MVIASPNLLSALLLRCVFQPGSLVALRIIRHAGDYNCAHELRRQSELKDEAEGQTPMWEGPIKRDSEDSRRGLIKKANGRSAVEEP